MDLIMEIWAYIKLNYTDLIVIPFLVLLAFKFVARLTPSKKDDDLANRLLHGLDNLYSFLKIPNFKKKEGYLIPLPDGTHPEKPKVVPVEQPKQ